MKSYTDTKQLFNDKGKSAKQWEICLLGQAKVDVGTVNNTRECSKH